MDEELKSDAEGEDEPDNKKGAKRMKKNAKQEVTQSEMKPKKPKKPAGLLRRLRRYMFGTSDSINENNVEEQEDPGIEDDDTQQLAPPIAHNGQLNRSTIDEVVMKKAVENDERETIVKVDVEHQENRPLTRSVAQATEFPTTLDGFGYYFNKEGQLRSIQGEEPFLFNVRPNDNAYNQRHYEALGDVITEYVYNELEKAGLKRIEIPIDATDDEPKGFFFASELNQEKPLLILIHGSGAVRAGIWARRLIMNDCLDTGTQLPYIHKAFDRGWQVIVLNGNHNRVADANGRVVSIRGNQNPSSHAQYIWRNIVAPLLPLNVVIAAHSAGGYDVCRLAEAESVNFNRCVKSVVFTDAVTAPPMRMAPWWRHIRKVAINWVTSDRMLDTVVSDVGNEWYDKGLKCLSAGTTRHDTTSSSCIESAFAHMDQCLSEFVNVEKASSSNCTNTPIDEDTKVKAKNKEEDDEWKPKGAAPKVIHHRQSPPSRRTRDNTKQKADTSSQAQQNGASSANVINGELKASKKPEGGSLREEPMTTSNRAEKKGKSATDRPLGGKRRAEISTDAFHRDSVERSLEIFDDVPKDDEDEPEL